MVNIVMILNSLCELCVNICNVYLYEWKDCVAQSDPDVKLFAVRKKLTILLRNNKKNRLCSWNNRH